MSMYSPTYDDLTARFPAEREAISRLFALLSTGGHKSVTFNRLLDLTEATSVEALALVLAELANANMIHRIVRVESPVDHGGIGDFDSLVDVPATLFDPSTGQDINVDLNFVREIFEIPGR